MHCLSAEICAVHYFFGSLLLNMCFSAHEIHIAQRNVILPSVE